MILSNINLAQIKWLHKNKLTLSHVKYMELLLNNQEIPQDKYYTDLNKLGIIFGENITDHGKNIYETFLTIEGDVDIKKIKAVKRVNEEFERWWKVYPATASLPNFVSIRILRVAKDHCQTLYEGLQAEENFIGTDEMIRLLQLEVKLRTAQSAPDKRNKNELEFMKGTESYLNSRAWEVWLEWEKNQKLNKPKNYTI